MAVLGVKRILATGEVSRLHLVPMGGGDRRLAEMVQGRGQSGSDITYPADPDVLDELIQVFGERLTLSTEANLWHTDATTKAQKAAQIAAMSDIPSSAPRVASLYPYQRVGVAWLRLQRRAILGDQPGLGKTAQALLACSDLKNVLIVTMAGIKTHWQDETRRWLGFNATAATGDYEARKRLLATKPGWLIVNYEMLRQGKNAYAALFNRKWDAVIFDEAHKLQGRTSSQSKGAERLTTERIYMLTGTPVWNKPESVWNLLHILYPRAYSSYWEWINANCSTVQRPWALEITGIRPDRMPYIQKVLARLVLRRLKLDVLKQLPPKVYETIEWEMTPGQRKAYRRIKKELRLEVPGGDKIYPSVAAALSDLRMLCNAPQLLGLDMESPKSVLIADLVNNLLQEPDRKIILFTWHKAYALYLKGMLDILYGAIVVTGDHSEEEREQRISFFRTSEVSHILVATIGATGTGINLVEADTAIFAEGAYVPAMNLQAEDRLHRIGQKTVATIYRLQAPYSIESALWDLTAKREELADEMLAKRYLAQLVQQEDNS